MTNVQIPVTISDQDKETFINDYVQTHMSDTSWEVFMDGCHDDLYNDNTHETALAKAVVNEMVNELLLHFTKQFYFPKNINDIV